MKEVIAHWEPGQWILVIGAFFGGIASCITAWRTGQKIDNHDARATARAREKGETANPVVRPEDRGHV